MREKNRDPPFLLPTETSRFWVGKTGAQNISRPSLGCSSCSFKIPEEFSDCLKMSLSDLDRLMIKSVLFSRLDILDSKSEMKKLFCLAEQDMYDLY